MAEAVFYDRLNRHLEALFIQQFLGDIHMQRNAAGLLHGSELDVLPNDLHFLPQGDDVVIKGHDIPKKRTQLGQHPAGLVVLIEDGVHLNGVDGVIEEMRMDLGLHGQNLRILFLQFGDIGFLNGLIQLVGHVVEACVEVIEISLCARRNMHPVVAMLDLVHGALERHDGP